MEKPSSSFPASLRRARTLRATCAAAVLAAALPGAASGEDAFWGERDVVLGDGVSSTLTGRDGEVHLFHFAALQGTGVEATLTASGGTDLVPLLRLVRPGGTPVDTGRKLVRSGTRTTLRNFAAPYSGWFAFEVTAKSGSGGYRLTTRGALAKGLRGFVPDAAAGDATYRFAATEGATLSLKLSPGKGGAKPRIVGIDDPEGAPLALAPVDRGRTSKIVEFPLPRTGAYVLRWTNEGRRGDVDLDFSFRNPVVAKTERILPASSGRPGSVVDGGAPVLEPREGYVGSAACGRCHDGLYRDWAQTVHNLAVRTWDRAGLTGKSFANDLDGDGIDDFREGLDLATVPAFAVYGVDAPKLGYQPGAAFPYKVRIGAVTYDVHRTMGGNGMWKQRYLTQAGRSYYVLPVQFNDAARTYATYNPADWYDTANKARFTDPGQIPKDKSFEANCSGCHNTGETIEVSSGEFVTGHTDFNIGCEQCHGPGAAHARTGDTTRISNPRDLVDGTAEGVADANEVCARCHTRGTAVDAFPATTKKAGFGYRADLGVQQTGDPQSEFFSVTTTATDFWGRKTNPFPALPGDTYVASKSHRQQSLDMATGRHGPYEGFSATCFDCHDPHRRARKHQIATAVDRGTRVETASDDNSLCLACHAGVPGPFAGVPKADVAAIASGTTPYSVSSAVVAHMADRAAMPVALALHDPVGTGVGRCTTCHMVNAPRTAVSGTDRAGYTTGDLHSHTFTAIWPRASVRYGVTNSCNGCHPTVAGDPVATILKDWATDDEGDGTFHADTPSSFQNGTANAGGAGGGQRCATCHTTEGFLRGQVRGETLAQADADRIVKDAIGRDKGIACDACHGARSDGTFAAGPNPLRMEKGVLCGSCHNAQTVVFDDFLARGEMVRHPTREMFDGTAGAEVPGSGTYDDSFHSNPVEFADACLVCHYDPSRSGASHRFAPQVSTCGRCHQGLTTFNRPSQGDWDGDGSLEGVQDEVRGLLDAVQVALVADPRVTFSASGYFEFDGATDHRMTGASEAQKRAAFNWYSVSFDGSLGVHNAVRSVQLLQRSYRELTGQDLAGADLR